MADIWKVSPYSSQLYIRNIFRILSDFAKNLVHIFELIIHLVYSAKDLFEGTMQTRIWGPPRPGQL